MNDFDQAARYAAKTDPPEFFRWTLPRLDPALTFHRWGDTRTLPFPGEPDRICDTVAEFTDPGNPGRGLVVVTEFQSRPQGDMLYRLDEYKARLLRELAVPVRELPFRRVVAVLVNLTGPPQPIGFNVHAPGHPDVGCSLSVKVITVCEEDAGLTLAAIASGALGKSLLPWIPLMRGGDEVGIIQHWKRVTGGEPAAAEVRRRLAALALVFSVLADCREAWKPTLEDWNVDECEFMAEQRRKGAVKARQADTLRAMQLRFPPVIPSDLRTAIEAMTDLDELTRWFDAAVTAPSLDAFRVAIGREPARA